MTFELMLKEVEKLRDDIGMIAMSQDPENMLKYYHSAQNRFNEVSEYNFDRVNGHIYGDDMVFEVSSLKSNINRICCTNDLEDMIKNYREAQKRFIKISEYHFNRLKSNND